MTEHPVDASWQASGRRIWRAVSDLLDDRAARAAICAIALAQACEAIAWLVVVLFAGRGHGSLAIGIAAASSAASFIRRLIQTRLLRSLRMRIARRIARGSLSESAILRPPSPDADPLAHFFDGGYVVARALAEGLPSLCGDALATVVLTALLVTLEPASLVVAVAVATSVSVLFALLVWRTSAARFAEAHARLTEVAGPMMTLASAREEVLASGVSTRFLDELDARLLRWVDASAKADRLVSVGGRVPAIAVAGFLAAVTIIERGGVAGLRLDELAPLGVFVCVLRPLVGLMRGSFEFTRLRPKLEAIISYVDPTPRPNGSRTMIPTDPSPIRWRAVSYAYPSEAQQAVNVIEDFDAEWSAGQLTVLGGPNGSGKSTLLRLLLGIVAPRVGEIRLGDTPLHSVDLDAWRRMVAYVPQRPYFPERVVVRDALAFGGLHVADDAAERALDDIGVLDALRRASASAPLDVRIDSLSAGQRQRIALTRAFRDDARLVILDEPDANLDAAGVAMLCDRLVKLARSRIVVVAAHSTELARVAGNTVRLKRAPIERTVRGE